MHHISKGDAGHLARAISGMDLAGLSRALFLSTWVVDAVYHDYSGHAPNLQVTGDHSHDQSSADRLAMIS